MKKNLALNEKSRIAREILAYLVEHTDAQDTLDGIILWWLPEQEIKYEIGIVKEIVSELVENELLLARKGMDSRIHYRINREKYEDIQSLLKEMTFRQAAP